MLPRHVKCENLETVFVQDVNFPRASADQAFPFLLAIQQNPKVQTVRLDCLQLSGTSFASFLDSATSVTALALCRCGMEAPGGARAIADALQRNTNIETLLLDRLSDIDLHPILNSLASNTGVQELVFRNVNSLGESSLALRRLLQTTMTIRQFEFNTLWFDLDTF